MGVEDEQTGELTLHEAGHAYALRQSVGGRRDSVEDHAMEGLEWKQRKDALVNQFGSKKKKAAIRCARIFLVPGSVVVVVVIVVALLGFVECCRGLCVFSARRRWWCSAIVPWCWPWLLSN